MAKALRLRFWIETSLATITSILFVITLIWPQWIEMVFHFSPDNGTGSFERMIVLIFLGITLIFSFLGGYEWKKARATSRELIKNNTGV